MALFFEEKVTVEKKSKVLTVYSRQARNESDPRFIQSTV